MPTDPETAKLINEFLHTLDKKNDGIVAQIRDSLLRIESKVDVMHGCINEHDTNIHILQDHSKTAMKEREETAKELKELRGTVHQIQIERAKSATIGAVVGSGVTATAMVMVALLQR